MTTIIVIPIVLPDIIRYFEIVILHFQADPCFDVSKSLLTLYV